MAWNNSGDNKPNNPWGGGDDNKPQPPELDKIFKDIKKQFASLLGGKPGKPNKPVLTPLRLLVVLVVALAGVLVFKGFYQVPTGQVAVVLSQGKTASVEQPGVHWLNPLLAHYKLVTTGSDSYRLGGELPTADGGLLKVGIEVDYKIADPAAYVLAADAPISLLQNAALATLRQQIGRQSSSALLEGNTDKLAASLEASLHEAQARWHTGVKVTAVAVNAIALPSAVKSKHPAVAKRHAKLTQELSAARNAQQAQQLKVKGKTAELLRAANLYSKQVVDEARGKTSRFTALLKAYKKAPEVTRERLYMDTMETVLSHTSKVLVVGGKGQQQLVSLPLAGLLKASGKVSPANADKNAAKAAAPQASDAKSAAKAAKQPPSLYGTSTSSGDAP